jgi:hypothetical protein
MPVGITTEYDQTQPWSSINTPNGVYKQTPDQIQKMAHALACANPELPAEALRVYAPTGVVATGLDRQPTIDDVLQGYAGQPPQMSIFDYSSTATGGMIASNQPNISY